MYKIILKNGTNQVIVGCYFYDTHPQRKPAMSADNGATEENIVQQVDDHGPDDNSDNRVDMK
jgi:hypothetical protein